MRETEAQGASHFRCAGTIAQDEQPSVGLARQLGETDRHRTR